MTKRVLLTGASGFVGSHVLRHLLVNTDWDIVCPVTFTHKGVQDRIRLSVEDNPEYFKRVKLIHVDLSAPLSSVTAHAFGRIDYVLNLASESHVDRSIEEPAPFVINNVQLICYLLDWARNTDHLDKFVHISTDEVYGPAPIGHDHVEWEDLHFPSNPYSASKAAQEDICYAYWRTYGVPLIVTNTMNIIGEMQDTEKFVPLVDGDNATYLDKMTDDFRAENNRGPSAEELQGMKQIALKSSTIDFGTNAAILGVMNKLTFGNLLGKFATDSKKVAAIKDFITSNAAKKGVYTVMDKAANKAVNYQLGTLGVLGILHEAAHTTPGLHRLEKPCACALHTGTPGAIQSAGRLDSRHGSGP